MSNVQILEEQDVYMICMLVKHGWIKSGGHWYHPQKLKRLNPWQYLPEDPMEIEEWDLTSAYNQLLNEKKKEMNTDDKA